MRHIVLATCLALVAGCGGGEPSLTEYAEEVEGVTNNLYQTLDELTIEWPSGPPTVQDYQAIYRGLATAYRELRAGLQAIEPPREAADLHNVSLDIVNRLTTAQDALARRAEAVETEDELNLLFDSPEAQAANAAQEEMIAFCQGAQAQFDATADREPLQGMPWIPTELQEVVLVFFGCEDEPGGNS